MRTEGGREVNHHGKMITVGGEEESNEIVVKRYMPVDVLTNFICQG
jgi:hypothetical protein